MHFIIKYMQCSYHSLVDKGVKILDNMDKNKKFYQSCGLPLNDENLDTNR